MIADLKTYAWGAGNAVSITGTSTTAQDLGESALKIVMVASTKTHVRFGTSSVGAATTNDVWLPADVPIAINIAPHLRYFRAIRASSDGTLTWALVS